MSAVKDPSHVDALMTPDGLSHVDVLVTPDDADPSHVDALMTQTPRMALLASLVMGDSDKIKTLVHKHMLEKYGQVRQIREPTAPRASPLLT
eukprot:325334-Chlamydomonas_euryale.AAC.1